MMPAWNDAERGYPPRDHVVEYLTAYEARYDVVVQRPTRVESVTRADDDPHGRLLVTTGRTTLAARAVVSATGTGDRPFWPAYPGAQEFTGGNSAAQVLAEVSTVADTTSVTSRPPRFLPDVDGRVLFATARARVKALAESRDHAGGGRTG